MVVHVDTAITRRFLRERSRGGHQRARAGGGEAADERTACRHDRAMSPCAIVLRRRGAGAHRQAYSGLRLASLMICRNLALSTWTKAANWSTAIGIPSAPASSSLALTSGSTRMRLISVLSRVTMSAGVPRGAKKPCQSVMSKPAMPLASATVGTSGALAERRPDDTAMSLRLPALTCGTAAGNPEKNRSTWPPRRSLSAGPAPLYGTWVMLLLVLSLSTSPAKCPGVAVPADANASARVFAVAIISATVE